MDFEHAIKMDVRNNPIVREIDEARQREMWRWLLVSTGLVAVILFSLWQRFSVIRLGAEVERMQRELAEEQVVNVQLKLTAEQLSTPGRIEALASKAPLHMTAPTSASTQILSRATSAIPPRTAVAARHGAGSATPEVPR
jgi:hypothetical protein